jgi:nucleoside phosphorylase
VAGLALEARGLRRRLGAHARRVLIVHAVGPGAPGLAGLDALLAAARPDALLVTGLAGGCAPHLATGDLVLGDPVREVGRAPAAPGPDPALCARALRAIARAGLRHHAGPLLTVHGLVGTPAAKRALWDAEGALAVDMESAHVLAWAGRAGLPAVAVRSVADGPTDALPPEFLEALDPGGRVRAAAVAGLVRRPALAGAAWRLGRRSRRALGRLGRFLQALVDTPGEP